MFKCVYTGDPGVAKLAAAEIIEAASCYPEVFSVESLIASTVFCTNVVIAESALAFSEAPPAAAPASVDVAPEDDDSDDSDDDPPDDELDDELEEELDDEDEDELELEVVEVTTLSLTKLPPGEKSGKLNDGNEPPAPLDALATVVVIMF